MYNLFGRKSKIQPDHQSTQAGGNSYNNITVSDNARVIFGDVYTSCADVLNHLTRDEECRTLAQALRYNGMHDRFKQITTAAPETCEWVWSSSFDQWIRQPEDDGIFWISGKPGSGKSTLMKYLVKSSETLDRLPRHIQGKHWKVVHFFYNFRIDRDMANTEEGMLRSILTQILETLQGPNKPDCEPRQANIDAIARDAPIEETATTIIRFLRLQSHNFFLLIDGLDECGSNLRAMVNTLKHVQRSTGVLICLASRPEAILQAALHNTKQIKMQELNFTGIEAYASNALIEIGQTLHLPQLSVQTLLNEIIARAEGVFLFVYFSVEMIVERLIRGFTISEIRGEVRQMPQELSQMYDRIFEAVPLICRAEVAFILDLIENTTQVLHLEQLFPMWYFFKTRLEQIGVAPVGINIDQFKIRLVGLLGSVLEIPESRPIYAWTKYPTTVESGAFELMAEPTRSPHSRLLSLSNKLTVAMTPNTPISIMHETVRSYIWRHNLIGKWSSKAYLQTFDTLVWPSLHAEVILDAEKRLGASIWDIIRNIGNTTYEYWIPVSCQMPENNECMHGRLAFFDVMNKFFAMGSLTSSSFVDAENYSLALLWTLDEVVSRVTQEEHSRVRGEQFPRIIQAWKSPIMLLHDIVQRVHRCETVELDLICSSGRAWHHDVFFMMSHFPSYVVPWPDTSELESRERDSLIASYLSQKVSIWYRSNLTENKRLADFADGIQHIITGPNIETRHLAIYMTAALSKTHSVHPSWQQDWQRFDALIEQKRHSAESCVVQKGYQPQQLYQRFECRDLLQISCEGDSYGRFGDPNIAFKEQRDLQRSLSLSLHSLLKLYTISTWRSSSNSNVVQCVLENYEASKPLHLTVCRLMALQAVGADFLEPCSTGATTLKELRAILEQNLGMHDAWEKNLFSRNSPLQKYSNPVIIRALRGLINDIEDEESYRRLHNMGGVDTHDETLAHLESSMPLRDMVLTGTAFLPGEVERVLKEYSPPPSSSDTISKSRYLPSCVTMRSYRSSLSLQLLVHGGDYSAESHDWDSAVRLASKLVAKVFDNPPESGQKAPSKNVNNTLLRVDNDATSASASYSRRRLARHKQKASVGNFFQAEKP